MCSTVEHQAKIGYMNLWYGWIKSMQNAYSINISSVLRELHTPFVISRGAKTHAECIVVHLSLDKYIGRGEGVPYARYGETVEGCIEQINNFKSQNDWQHQSYRELKGAARNAFNCAMWDLIAKISHRPIWELLNIERPKTIRGTQTLSLTTPDLMAKEASEFINDALIKIKLGGDDDIECIKAVRNIRPHAEIIVDANEGWNLDDYQKIIPELLKADVTMIEQPFPTNEDEALRDLERPIPICADESVHTSENLDLLVGKYDMVNIKLDKTGGLTEALKLRNVATKMGMSYMIGCMVGSSLSMAPAMLLANDATYVDLDGPLFLKEDVEHGIKFDGGIMHPFTKDLWG